MQLSFRLTYIGYYRQTNLCLVLSQIVDTSITNVAQYQQYKL